MCLVDANSRQDPNFVEAVLLGERRLLGSKESGLPSGVKLSLQRVGQEELAHVAMMQLYVKVLNTRRRGDPQRELLKKLEERARLLKAAAELASVVDWSADGAPCARAHRDT